ncbi:hypothetical protein EN817_17530 [Mesorhizobium sp. M3A.F.Ca.ET.174.01.1.1]|uniref:hypothetical protein n=1 Tax=unclassified Mesorhizobium TaxID=325217 RepID=UPI001093B688|nr:MULTISPECIES: hypothetical protein [unclassified Mesorhizobium]TGS86703.1 hypothetical protein EN818_15385 [Mesorhizobium sp. M3A.F.Ca.ET.175.01.1.1]TGT25151.1 hypothetical protein EN817_17530 [Mesorhizobium sp. M3A.F.Ca.ET.174.01.1.1]
MNGLQMRDGFREIVSGWMLVDDFDDLTDRIERSALWAKENGPLLLDEEATVKCMIETQIARGLSRGDFDDLRRLMGCRSAQSKVRPDGGCLACPAVQGEACRLAEVMLK